MRMCIVAIAGVDPLVFVGVVLLGLLAGLSWLSRRVRGGAGWGTGLGRGREMVALTGEHAVHVVEIAGRRLLVGTGPSGAPRVLAELGEVEAGVGAELETKAPIGRPWAELLERFGGLGGR